MSAPLIHSGFTGFRLPRCRKFLLQPHQPALADIDRGVDVAVMLAQADLASTAAHAQAGQAIGACAAGASAAVLGRVGLVDFFEPSACVIALVLQHGPERAPAGYEDVKSPYQFFEDSEAHPNGGSGSLDALEVRYGIPVIYTSRNKMLAEEKAASWLSKTFTYWWLESQGMGRVLQEGDL